MKPFALLATIALMLVLLACATEEDPTTPSVELFWQQGVTNGPLWIQEVGQSKREIKLNTCIEPHGSAWTPTGTHLTVECGVDSERHMMMFDPQGNLIAQIGINAMECGFAQTSDAHYCLNRSRYEVRHYRVTVEFVSESESVVIDEVWPGSAAAPVPPAFSEGEQILRAGLSPNGEKLTFYRARTSPCTPTCQTGLIVHDLGSGDEESFGDLVPLAWVRGGAAVIAGANYAYDGYRNSYDAQLLDLTTGETTRLTQIDDNAQFWLSADANVAAFVPPPDAENAYEVGVIDLSSGKAVTIEGGRLSYGCCSVPMAQVLVADDGYVYWLTDTREGLGSFRARFDGTEYERVGTLERAYNGAIAPDLRHVAYLTAGEERSELFVAKLDGSDAELVTEYVSSYEWRPQQVLPAE